MKKSATTLTTILHSNYKAREAHTRKFCVIYFEGMIFGLPDFSVQRVWGHDEGRRSKWAVDAAQAR
jgi:hypothetical protein